MSACPRSNAGPLLDRQLRMLGRLAEFGVEIAEALANQAKGTGPKVTDGDIALAYSRVSRAVRRAILLRSRLVDEGKARAAAAEEARAEARAPTSARASASTPTRPAWPQEAWAWEEIGSGEGGVAAGGAG